MLLIGGLFVLFLIVATVINSYLDKKHEEARKRERLSRRYSDAI